MKIVSALVASIALAVAVPFQVVAGPLEPSTEGFVKALAAKGGPPIYQLSPQEARKVLEDAQAGAFGKVPAEIEDRTIVGGPTGGVSLRIFRPNGSNGRLPVIMYFHGGGWMLGSKATHDRLVREIANGAKAAVVFVT